MRLMLVIILTFKVSIYRARVAETGELEETPILLEVEKYSSFLADIGLLRRNRGRFFWAYRDTLDWAQCTQPSH